MPHYDLSVYAFEKLADLSWGVIGINWRRVPCDHQPAQQAPPIANPWCAHTVMSSLLMNTCALVACASANVIIFAA